MEVKDITHYKEDNYFNIFRIFLDSSHAVNYFNLLSAYLDEVYLENSQGPKIFNILKSEFKSLYKSKGIEIDDLTQSEVKEGTVNNNMGNATDLGRYWYENLIKSVKERMRTKELSADLWKELRVNRKINIENPFLGVIYDYDKLNALGQSVMRNSGLTSKTYYPYLVIDPSKLKDHDTKMKATRELITNLIDHPSTGVAYIFWALFVLTVDHTDYEQHLSEICNLADLIGIHEIVILDLMDIINAIYRRVAPETIQLRSTMAHYVFYNVICMYGIRVN